MTENKKQPNYLKIVLIIISAVIFFLAVLSVIAFIQKKQTEKNILKLIAESGYLNNEIVSDNLVSYIKTGLLPKPVITEESPTLGNENAPVTIFEYADFGCDYSADIQPIITEIMTKYTDQVKLVWKDLPTADSNNELLAHLAGRCAQKQNKFWEYHDKLWELKKSSSGFNLKNLSAIATELKLDEKEFSVCLNSEETYRLISADVAEADSLLIPATPHFYINNQEIMGQADLADFEKIIDLELNK